MVRASMVAVFLLIVAASGAHAQAAETDARDTEARSLFEAGEMAYADGRYEDALARFREAYGLSPRPQLLFNIGAAAERLRRDDEAIDHYQRYLDQVPDAGNRREVEARLRVLRSHQSSEQDDAALEPSNESGGPNIPAWILGATTVAFAGASLGAWLGADSAYSDLESECIAAGGCTEERIQDSKVKPLDRLALASLVLAGASAVATVLAIVLVPSEHDEEPSVALGVGVGHVTLRGRF